jgi:hypothetical protein
MKINFEEYKVIDKGALKSVFKFSIPELKNLSAHGSYFVTDRGQSWITLDPKEYVNKEGQKKSFGQLKFDTETMTIIEQAVKEKHNKMSESSHKIGQSTVDDDELPF